MIIHYHIHEVTSAINWVYFFHAWGFQPRFAAIANIHGCDVCRASWLTVFPEEERAKAAEAMQLFKEANRMLDLLDKDYRTHAVYGFYPANADGDDLILGETRLPLLRQQTRKKPDAPFLCLSDFVRPLSQHVADTVGVFASCVDAEMETLYAGDPYKRMLVQTLCDRLAEATTEKTQEQIAFKGIRPAVGYPSLPDQSVIFVLDEVLHFDRIGIRLTENGMMQPHASTSGLLISHPEAKYFSVGKIGEDQLADYARRRGKSPEEMRRFLAANL